MLVVDASVVVAACLASTGFARYEGEELAAPPLLWPESRSVLHRMAWLGAIAPDVAPRAREQLESAPIAARNPRRLGLEAWHVADRLGWAKTYDAEYLAVALLLDVGILTLDAQMQRAAKRLGIETASV